MFDVVIVGAGPAAAAALRGIAGANVVVVDAGANTAPQPGHRPTAQTWADWRSSSEDQWQTLVDGRSTRRSADVSPKLQMPHVASVVETSLERIGIRTENFAGPLALALGGLSNFWGAGVAVFESRDFAAWPIGGETLAPFYKAEIASIGVSGPLDVDSGVVEDSLELNPPLDLHPLARRLSRRPLRSGAQFLPALNAVLTRPADGRAACDLLGACFIGCPNNAIYNAAHDLARAFASGSAQHVPNYCVDHLVADRGGWAVVGRDSDGTQMTITGKLVVLAAGAIGSAAIVLRTLGQSGRMLPLVSTPSAGFAGLFPLQYGRPVSKRFFGLSQLTVQTPLDDDGREWARGHLFTTDGLPAAPFIEASGLLRSDARRLLRGLLPSMLAGSFFFPGLYSNHRIELEANGVIKVTGGFRVGLNEARKRAERELRSLFQRERGILAPGGLRLSPPGGDIHYAATLRHQSIPGPYETWPDGRLGGLAGVYVADGSVIPTLPAKPHTLTLMANARRIGEEVKRKLASLT